MTFLAMLNMELASIQDDFVEPSIAASAGETVLAVMNDYQKRLFTLFIGWSKEMDRYITEMKYAPEDRREDLFRHAHQYGYLSDAAKEILYCDIRSTFELWEYNLGLRRGWKVVKAKRTKLSITDILDGLLGQGPKQ